MDCLHPYREYKDSGLPWLGTIPAHWEIRRNGRLFSQRNETGFADLPILEVSLRTGVRVRDFENSQRKQVMSDRDKYKRAAKGDIPYNMMRLWQGAVGVAPVDGLVSPAYVVARPNPEVDTRYYAYLFRTAAYMNEVNKYSHGIVVDRNRLYWDEFKQMPSVYPPPHEQRRIANFLDEHGRYVRQFIRNKRRVIELLNEQKQAIINQAVTRGLDQGVQTVVHSDAWIGEVPAHWTVHRLKHIARFNPSKAEAVARGQIPDRVVFLPMERISVDGVIDCSELRSTADIWNGYTYFRRNDVVVAKITPCFENGKGAYLCQLTSEFGFGTTELIVLRASAVVLPQFLYLLTHSTSFRLRGEEQMTGSAGQKRLPVEFVKDYPLALPPIPEQDGILLHIEQATYHLDASVERATREIDLIREYRTRLIADVVTGKLDVRQVASETVEPSLDGLQVALGGEELAEDDLVDSESPDLDGEADDADD